MINIHRLSRIISCLFLITGLALIGCGDEAFDGDNDASQNQATNDDDGECDDGKFLHPIQQECVEDDRNDNDSNDNSDVNDINDVNGDENQMQECGPGRIDGQTCRPDGGVLPGAEVVLEGVDCDGDEFQRQTTADGNGYYSLIQVPAGEHELTISSGSFEVVDDVTVFKDQVTDLESTEDAKVCLQGDEVDIAVFPGEFDKPHFVLEEMGVAYDWFGDIDNSTLSQEAEDLIYDLEALKEYDILFIGCQVDEPMVNGAADPIAMDNLRLFVEDGNSVYASDRAHPWVHQAIPGAIPFELDYDPDDVENDPAEFRGDIQTGAPAGDSGDVIAEVLSDEMLDLLQEDTVEFVFDTPNWTIVAEDELGPTGTAHFRIDTDISWGGDGTYENASVVTTYDDPIGNGRVIYTSFHNSAQVTDDMMEILEYMVFQL